MLDLSRLRMLMALRDEGSISAAARSMRYTAAAVSQQISKLEREAGMELVSRHSRGVTLTPSGDVLVEAGRDVMLRLAQAENSARRLAGMETARLRVATFQSASASLLPKILAPLCERFPSLGLEFVQVPRDEALQMLRRHEADVALIHEHPEIPGGIEQPGLIAEFLHADLLRLVAAPHHAAAVWPEPVDLTSLDGQALIVGRVEDDDRQVLDELFAKMGVVPVQVAEVGEYFIAAAMASSGIAVTLMPVMAIPAGYSLVTKRLEQDLERRVFLATREADESVAVAAFREMAFHVMRPTQPTRPVKPKL